MSEAGKVRVLQKSFIDLAVEGKVAADDLDDFVEAWHKEPQDQPLHQFLGMSEPEYSLWLRDPDMLSFVLRARQEGRPLTAVIDRTYQELRSAGRPTDR